jgi:tartrate-resistant acid phosphatase type 5
MSLLSRKYIIIVSVIIVLLFTVLLSELIYTKDLSPICHTTNRPYQLLLPPTGATQFAIIGDYGDDSNNQWHVTELLYDWDVDFIVTVGDNNYPAGSVTTIDENIGQYYSDYIGNYHGMYGEGSVENRFFPVLGNHDWRTDTAQAYLDYFTLPGNERYYDFVQGSVHFFMLDSDYDEPDGVTADSVQAQWLQAGLAASTTPFQLVFMHHPPYTSGHNGSTEDLRWAFAAWGADAVFAGHDHNYERLVIDGIPYIVNGLGGHSISGFNSILPSSQAQYNCDYGAMRVIANATSVTMQFVTFEGDVVDSYTLPQHTVVRNHESSTTASNP